MEPQPLDLDRILNGLSLLRLARPGPEHTGVLLVDQTASTNDIAWQRAEDPSQDGLVVIAEHQTAGRGRLGRSWLSPPRASLLLSVLLREPPTPFPAPIADQAAIHGARLALITAVACADAIVAETAVEAEIRWPNDLLVEGRKLGGILVESRRLAGEIEPAEAGAKAASTVYVVGIGLNCFQRPHDFPPALQPKVCSLAQVASVGVDRSALARALLSELDRWYARSKDLAADEVHQAWLRRSLPLGSRITLTHNGQRYTGNIVDLDPTAALVVQLDQGPRRLFDAASTTICDHDS